MTIKTFTHEYLVPALPAILAIAVAVLLLTYAQTTPPDATEEPPDLPALDLASRLELPGRPPEELGTWDNMDVVPLPPRPVEASLTISNRPWLWMKNAVVVRVTDEEWDVLTNAFAQYLTTERILFYWTP